MGARPRPSTTTQAAAGKQLLTSSTTSLAASVRPPTRAEATPSAVPVASLSADWPQSSTAPNPLVTDDQAEEALVVAKDETSPPKPLILLTLVVEKPATPAIDWPAIALTST